MPNMPRISKTGMLCPLNNTTPLQYGCESTIGVTFPKTSMCSTYSPDMAYLPFCKVNMTCGKFSAILSSPHWIRSPVHILFFIHYNFLFIIMQYMEKIYLYPSHSKKLSAPFYCAQRASLTEGRGPPIIPAAIGRRLTLRAYNARQVEGLAVKLLLRRVLRSVIFYLSKKTPQARKKASPRYAAVHFFGKARPRPLAERYQSENISFGLIPVSQYHHAAHAPKTNVYSSASDSLI